MRMVNILVLLSTINLIFGKPDVHVFAQVRRAKLGEEGYRKAMEYRERRLGEEILSAAMAMEEAIPSMIAASRGEPSLQEVRSRGFCGQAKYVFFGA